MAGTVSDQQSPFPLQAEQEGKQKVWLVTLCSPQTLGLDSAETIIDLDLDLNLELT